MSKSALLSPVSRKDTLAKIKTGEATDNVLFGLNHLTGVEYLTIGDYLKHMPRLLQALAIIPHLLNYDFVIAQDDFFVGYLISLCSRLFRLKTQWLYVSISSSTLIRRHKNHPFRLFLLKKFWASYARIICLSHEQIEDLVTLGIPRAHLIFVPYGVDAAFFQKDAAHEEELIVSVGRDAGRDYSTLLKAAEHSNYLFSIIASQKNIPLGTVTPSNVSVFYNKSIVEVRDFFTKARLVVVVSKAVDVPDGSDCSGQTVILESLAAGKAVVATHRPWIADYLVDGEDLLVVPPNNPEALTKAIDSLWSDTGKRERIASSGRAKVLARYTSKQFGDSLQELMESIARKH